MSKAELSFLCLGVDAPSLTALTAAVPTANLQASGYEMTFFEQAVPVPPLAILCGTPPEEMQPVEVAQSLRMIYPTTPIFFLTLKRETFNRKSLQKNGFTDAFLLPTDQSVLNDAVQRMLALAGELKVFRNVRLVDIPSDNVLGFDLYLHMPANNKYIKYAASTDVLDASRLERLNNKQINTISVSEDQMEKFYEFTAAQLKKLGSSTTISETEKRQLRERAVRDLFTGIFGESDKADSIGHGREVMNDCQQIIKSYIVGENAQPSKWIDKMLSISSTMGNVYNHAANVSTYAALFSIGLGIGNADEIALAGLLHDIGLADLPSEVTSKEDGERSPEEEAIYRKHPHLSVEMIREKKLIVPEKVMKIIAQHHERFDGKGYPEGVAGPKFLPEAQILALASLFDYLTAVKSGKGRLTPMQAIDEIMKMNSTTEGEMPFDPNLVNQIVGLFQSEAKAA